MAEVHKNGFNAALVETDLKNCCMEKDNCSQCQKEKCLIGYAKQCIGNYMKSPRRDVPRGMKKIPTTDFKRYEEDELETAIAHILQACKNCKEEHTENCIINVIRSCYEVGLFGDVRPYEGSALQYLMYLNTDFADKALKIAAVYKG